MELSYQSMKIAHEAREAVSGLFVVASGMIIRRILLSLEHPLAIYIAKTHLNLGCIVGITKLDV